MPALQGTNRLGLTAAESALVGGVLIPDRVATPGNVQIIYLGNSQTITIVDAGPGDLTSAQWLQLLFERNKTPRVPGVDVRQASLPGMAMPEMLVSMLSFAERRPPQVNVAVLAISLEFFRKSGLREEVNEMAANPAVKSALKSVLDENQDLPAGYNVLQPLISTSASQPSQKAGSAEKSSIDQVESWLENKASGWNLFAKRDRVVMKFDPQFIAWRNRMLGIRSTTPRPIPTGTYTANLRLLQMLFRFAKSNHIELVVYLTPIRQLEPNRYTASDRKLIDRDLARLCEEYGFPYFNYLTLEPGRVFAYFRPVNDGIMSLKFNGDPDFVHYSEEGHKILAERLFADAHAAITGYQGGPQP